MSERVASETQPGIGSVLRIMRSELYDPMSTPVGDYGKMRFDSRAGNKLGYVGYIETIGYRSDLNGDRVDYYLPSGRNINNFWTYCYSWYDGQNGSHRQLWAIGANYGDYGYFPLIEQRPTPDGVSFTGPSLKYQIQGQQGNPIVKEWGVMYGSAGYTSYSTYVFLSGGGTPNNLEHVEVGTISGGAVTRWVTTVFQLPARNVALPDFSTAPVVGQTAVEISNVMARVALPGRDVTSPDINHFVLHENKIPAKILGGGDVQINAGASATIYPRLPITPDTYLDYHIARVGEPMSHPPRPAGWVKTNPLSLNYTVYTDRVVVTNTGTDNFIMRYLVMAPTNVAKTSGGVEVFRRGNDGIGDFYQIKRPGSSDTAPSMADVLLDTRLTYLPIISEGFLNWATDFPNVASDPSYGERFRSITFPNNGNFKPFIKAAVVFPTRWYSGMHEVFVGNNASGWYGRCTCRSYHATLYDNQVDLYMAGSNPLRFNNDESVQYHYDGSPALGLRYYIFAIPV